MCPSPPPQQRRRRRRDRTLEPPLHRVAARLSGLALLLLCRVLTGAFARTRVHQWLAARGHGVGTFGSVSFGAVRASMASAMALIASAIARASASGSNARFFLFGDCIRSETA